MLDLAQLKTHICETIETHSETFIELGHQILREPWPR